MNTFKQQCIKLRRQDYTLPEIVKITGRSKSSVHFHIHGLPLSNLKLQKIQTARATQARRLGTKRRGISARLFRKFAKWNEKLVRLVAHFIFDGEIKHGGCVYNNRNMALLNKVEKDMRGIYLLEPRRYFNRQTGVSRISYYNVSLGAYLKDKSAELLQNIPVMPEKLQREFLRAFFDDEGCIDYRPDRNHRKVRGYQKNVAVLEIMQKLLQNFSIQSRVLLPNEITISGQIYIEKFQKEIGFSPGVRINGNRSNSIWKQSLEKREILRRAIASYKPIGSNGVHRT